jgi:hypothetical protein
MSTDTQELEQKAEGNGQAAAALEARKEATVMEIATIIAGSRDFPDCRTPEKAAVRILAGREMGVPAVTAVAGIRITNGRVSMDACLMAGMIERSEQYDFKKIEHNTERCILEFTRKGEVRGQAVFTMEEATKAGLSKKDVWRNYQFDMVFWRALSRGARQYCAGLFGGSVYIHEEIGLAMDGEGKAIDTDAGAAGGELCTRDQRSEVRRLVELLGMKEADYLASIGVKLLDELSGFEADKELKKLAKLLEKKQAKEAVSKQTTTVTVAPGETVKVETTPPLSDAQQMIADSFSNADKKCTEHQREQIISLAGQLEPDEEICREMLLAILGKRNCKRIGDLHYLDAATIIENMTAAVVEQNQKTPPFDPTPEPGK